jgi:hypothetical protein
MNDKLDYFFEQPFEMNDEVVQKINRIKVTVSPRRVCCRRDQGLEVLERKMDPPPSFPLMRAFSTDTSLGGRGDNCGLVVIAKRKNPVSFDDMDSFL